MAVCVKLNNGVFMPLVGLGTYQIKGSLTETACLAAVSSGYRAFDSAFCYGNESDIGKVLPICRTGLGQLKNGGENLSGIPNVFFATDAELCENKRLVPAPLETQCDPIFITTKVWVSDFGYDEVKASVNRSLKSFGVTRLDLVLLHWPCDAWGGEQFPSDVENQRRHDSWRALEEMLEEGKVRAIGVSNYFTHHLEDLVKYVVERQQQGDPRAVLPAVNQLEVNPLCPVVSCLRTLCEKYGIRLVSYSTLGSPRGISQVTTNQVIEKLAKKYNKSPAQVCLRWCVQSNISIIPRSKSPGHIAANPDIFDFVISESDMAEIATEANQSIRFCPDPSLLP